jgi:thiol-disulfide isomerase/thioredoxin
MNKKVLILPLLVLSLFIVSGCSNDNKTYYFKEDGTMTTVKPSVQPADKIQVFMFHATARCATCIAIGQLADATVNEYFSAELKSGKIEFREVNVDLPENKELATRFQASGSSLRINAIYDEQDHISEDVTVWRLTSDETQFKNYLKNKIDTILGK